MNAIDGAPGVLPQSLRHPRRRARCPTHARRRDRRAARPRASTSSSSRRPASARATPAIVPLVDLSLYVMTPEFGAASQLEKIDMLDFADVVAINKFERRGAEDALRDVRRQLVRNREAFDSTPSDMPVFGTSRRRASTTTASPRSTSTCAARSARARPAARRPAPCAPVDVRHSSGIRARRARRSGCRYLAEIAETVRGYHAARERGRGRAPPGAGVDRRLADGRRGGATPALARDERRPRRSRRASVGDRSTRPACDSRPALAPRRSEPLNVRDQAYADQPGASRSSGNAVPRVALPGSPTTASCVRFLRRENLPGRFPFTAGVFPFKRDGEDPARMFAGEGDPARTNRRFHLLGRGPAGHPPVAPRSTRSRSTAATPTSGPTSTARSATPASRVATLDDMKVLYDGFDLLRPDAPRCR